MKKTILIIIIVGLINHNSIHAQGPSIGIRAGLNFSNIKVDRDIDQLDTRVGFHAGAYLGVPIGDKFHFEPGLFLSTKGSKFNDKEMDSFGADIITYDFKIRIISYYIDVPVLLKMKITKNLIVFGGSQVSILLDNKIKQEFTECFNDVCITENMEKWSTENATDLDLALVLGISYELPAGFNLSAGYDYGITSVDTDSDDVFNRVFKVSVGYRLK